MDLFEHLFAIGDEMQDALAAQDLDRFFALAEERGTVLEELKTYPRPAAVTPEWTALTQALDRQQHALMSAALAEERRLGDTLIELERFKSARQQYRQPPGGSRILNDDLRV